MRSTLVLFGAFGTAVAHRQPEVEAAADSSTLLQAKQMVRKHEIKSLTADALLSNLKEMAQSLKQDSFAQQNPTDVTNALGTANDALTLMFPGFAQEHESAQNELDIQFGEIEACHASANHGRAARAENEARLASRLAESRQCEETLANAIETQVSECGEYTDLADNLISAGLPGCSAGDAGQLVEVGRNWREWVNANLGALEGHQAECNAATTAVETQSDLCAAMADAYEEAFCHTREACIHHNSCYDHEVEIYAALRDEVENAALIRQQQYRTAMQAQCLVGLMMNALATGTPITDAALTACDDVDVDDLTLSFPALPDEPEDCPASQEGDPPCDPVPHVPGWTGGEADGGAIDLSCNEGSPDSCTCELLDVQGYSAGAVVRCEHGLRVEKSTDVNSCPRGMKIFSPRDRADFDLLAPYLSRHTDEGRRVHSPNLIVDVTRPENGCGGCTGAAMNSNTPAQSSWVTSDGSPWWLSDTPFGEPNGDYYANCYMWVVDVHASHVHFNDARHGACHYNSNAYLCQPIQHYEEPPSGCHLLLDNYQFSNHQNSAAAQTLNTGNFDYIKATYVSGRIMCDRRRNSANMWQTCCNSGYSAGCGAAFELRHNDARVIEQPRWHHSAPQCDQPDGPTGDLICHQPLSVSASDTFIMTWFETDRRTSLGDNEVDLVADLYGCYNTQSD